MHHQETAPNAFHVRSPRLRNRVRLALLPFYLNQSIS